MPNQLRFTRVDFHRFKAFEKFSLHLRHFNILVGPNNAGKSTILASFRILAAAMRRAKARNPTIVQGPSGAKYGYVIDIAGISVAEENLFFNYDEVEPAHVRFRLSNGNDLTLFFPEPRACFLLVDGPSGAPRNTTAFKREFDCQVGFVPILGPVDHHEPLYREEAARLALYNYTAARNFRNIWYHYPERFEEFRELLHETWPGMDIDRPIVDRSYERPVLHMFCPEERIPREIFWAGFGFQVWCQMLTHIVQSSHRGVFLIDEPDIYLHADLQRQLIGLLRDLSADVLIATHSTEIITEAEPDDIVLIDKKRRSSRRIKQPAELLEVFATLGSNLNPVLTQLAKTRRVLFVEGLDFQIISKFARKLGHPGVANRASFAVVPVGGFSPERIRNLKDGMETTLGGKIAAAAILDRDYRSIDECTAIAEECNSFCNVTVVHSRKEIENFLLVPQALDRAAARKLADQNRRTGKTLPYETSLADIARDYVDEVKNSVASQYIAFRRRFDRSRNPGLDEATSNSAALKELDALWKSPETALEVVPGKEALGFVNRTLQERYGISVTPTGVIDAMNQSEIPLEVIDLVKELEKFAKSKPGATTSG